LKEIQLLHGSAFLFTPYWKKKVGNCPLITNVQDDFHGIPNTEKKPMQEKIRVYYGD
jgi:hypothetical protein